MSHAFMVRRISIADMPLDALPRQTDSHAASEEGQLNVLIERLVGAFRLLRIYLFGSRARGDVGPDSDFDLMVILPDNAEAAQMDSRFAYRALRGTGIATDVLVWSKTAFDGRATLISSLPYTILSEGKLVYGN